MNIKTVTGAVIFIVSIGGSVLLWHDSGARRKALIRADNTPLYQWEPGEVGDALVLYVSPKARYDDLKRTPPVPVDADTISIVGAPGTTPPNAYVQVLNERTRDVSGAQAKEDGAYEITLDAELGDVFRIGVIVTPRVQSAPASSSAISPQEVEPSAK